MREFLLNLYKSVFQKLSWNGIIAVAFIAFCFFAIIVLKANLVDFTLLPLPYKYHYL
jgi:hypothetical protein